MGRGEDGAYRKLCGILTEMRMEKDTIRDVVVGVGLNINQREFAEEIRDTATSFAAVLGRPLSRAKLTCSFWRHFEEIYETFLAHGGLGPLRAEYEETLVNRGREVRVLDPTAPFVGRALGIEEDGALRVERADGKVLAVTAGEVSGRGVEGYV